MPFFFFVLPRTKSSVNQGVGVSKRKVVSDRISATKVNEVGIHYVMGWNFLNIFPSYKQKKQTLDQKF